MEFIELDKHVTLGEQLAQEIGPVVLVNIFHVAPEDADQLLKAWADDALYFKRQPGFISAQIHRGIAGSGSFLNYAVWESVAHFRRALENPEFRAKLAAYPSSVVATPHLFQRVSVPNVCVA